jgi:hypothetical protein
MIYGPAYDSSEEAHPRADDDGDAAYDAAVDRHASGECGGNCIICRLEESRKERKP